jgi:5-hydroxyisourate hydrolase-like protein (transthyretin family)
MTIFSFAAPVLFLTATVAIAQFKPVFTISGEVRDEFGHLAPNIDVCASPQTTKYPRTSFCGQTDKNGRFTLRLAKPGTYELGAHKTSDGYMSQNRSFYKHASIPITELTLTEVNRDAAVSLSLGPKSGAISGKVVDIKTGLPVENVLITMCHADNPKDCYSTSAKNTEGIFKVFGSAVPFTLKIAAEGYEDWLGLSGSDTSAKGISLGSGTTIHLGVELRRRPDTKDAPLSEAEKQAGTHLPAPAQMFPADEAVFNHYPRTTRLNWSEIEGAASYVVEVDLCRGLESGKKKGECIDPQPFKPKGETTETSYEFSFVGAQPGRWRVWAVDKEGRAGFKSPWRKFYYTK